MGCYILDGNQTDSKGKALILCSKHGAHRIREPESFPAPTGKVYICVFENAWFDAAFVCLTEFDYRQAKYDDSGRPRTWLLMDRATVRAMVAVQYQQEPALQ